MRYFVGGVPLRRMMATVHRSGATTTAPIISSGLINCIGLITVVCIVFLVYSIYQEWNPIEKPMRTVATEEDIERLMHSMDSTMQSSIGWQDVNNDVHRQQHHSNQEYDDQRQWQQQLHHPQKSMCGNVMNQAYIPTRFRRKRLTPRQRRIVMERTQFCCNKCNKFCQIFDRELNHRISLSSNLYRYYDLNDLSNYELLCRKCHGLETYLQRERGEFRH